MSPCPELKSKKKGKKSSLHASCLNNKFKGRTFQAWTTNTWENFDHRSLLRNIFFDICQIELQPSWQNLDPFLENKVIKNLSYWKMSKPKIIFPNCHSSMKKNQKGYIVQFIAFRTFFKILIGKKRQQRSDAFISFIEFSLRSMIILTLFISFFLLLLGHFSWFWQWCNLISLFLKKIFVLLKSKEK